MKYQRCEKCGDDTIPHRYNQCQNILADGSKCNHLFDETYFKKSSFEDRDWSSQERNRMGFEDFDRRSDNVEEK